MWQESRGELPDFQAEIERRFRGAENLQRFSENLQRFSENLQRFSENLQRFCPACAAIFLLSLPQLKIND